MIEITGRARSELKRLLSRKGKAGFVLRLLPSPDGRLGIAVTPQRDGDEVIVEDGSNQLVMSRRIAAALDGGILDWEEGKNGGALSLSLRRPSRELLHAN